MPGLQWIRSTAHRFRRPVRAVRALLRRGEGEEHPAEPQLLLPLSDHRVSVRLDGPCLIRSRIRADHGSSLVFCPHRSFDAREAESVRGVAVPRHARDRECGRRVIDQENSLQARDESRERPPSASARARELEVRDPGDVAVPKRSDGRRRTADERTADAVVGAPGPERGPGREGHGSRVDAVVAGG